VAMKKWERGLESLDPWSSRHCAGDRSGGETAAAQPALGNVSEVVALSASGYLALPFWHLTAGGGF
jgi:hypothetical protein